MASRSLWPLPTKLKTKYQKNSNLLLSLPFFIPLFSSSFCPTLNDPNFIFLTANFMTLSAFEWDLTNLLTFLPLLNETTNGTQLVCNSYVAPIVAYIVVYREIYRDIYRAVSWHISWHISCRIVTYIVAYRAVSWHISCRISWHIYRGISCRTCLFRLR